MKIKSVKSINPCASVIQTVLSYDIVKAHGGELRVESLPHQRSGISSVESGLQYSEAGAIFIVILPILK